MKISDMILLLSKAKEKYGDVDVLLASDEEGNGYGNVDDVTGYDNKKLLIYPIDSIDPDEVLKV